MDYFEQQIKPHINGTQIEYLGEANHAEKSLLMGGAVAALFPITWREPFGLVMIESIVTGTPVIAMNFSSTSEVIVHGKTGFLCRSVEDCLSAIDRVPELNRYICREHVLRNFTLKQMTDGYEGVYSKLASRTTQDLSKCTPKTGHRNKIESLLTKLVELQRQQEMQRKQHSVEFKIIEYQP